MKSFKILIFTFVFVVVPLHAQRLPETIVRVGLVMNAASFNMSCEGAYYLYEISKGRQSGIKPLDDYLVKASGDKIVFGGKKYSSPARIVAKDGGNKLRINGRRYHDNITIVANNGKLTVINEIGLEDYINGIIPREVNPEWPIESLKAQAVVSRTYVLRNLRRHGKDGFDVCTQTHCQVYGGLESEDPRSNAAVEATRAEVLVYDGKLAQTLFHASCGGHTENPNFVWAWNTEAPAYLKGCKDGFCENSPHQNWENVLKADFIGTRLRKAGYNVGTIKNISLSGRDNSGRTKSIVVKHSKGTSTIPAAKFRMAIDPWYIRSTWFTSAGREGASFRFKGKGWGHGVGMCQWGAKEMSEKGRDHKEILRFYYPGTALEKWEE